MRLKGILDVSIHSKQKKKVTILIKWFTWHADAVKVSNLVQAGGFVHARVRHALVDVQLAAWPHVTPLALTLERAFGVQTLPCMLTWV